MSASPPGGAPAELHAPPPAEALAAWATACDGARPLPVVRVIVEDALGRVTAEPVWARRSSPEFPAAAMDGIAVASQDTGAGRARPIRCGWPGRRSTSSTPATRCPPGATP